MISLVLALFPSTGSQFAFYAFQNSRIITHTIVIHSRMQMRIKRVKCKVLEITRLHPPRAKEHIHSNRRNIYVMSPCNRRKRCDFMPVVAGNVDKVTSVNSAAQGFGGGKERMSVEVRVRDVDR